MTTSCPNTFHVAEHGLCVSCHAPRTVCRHCGIDVGASGADGGSWVPCPHRCVARPQGASTGPLSARMRPNSEAAPWVIEEVKRLEAENARLNAEVARAEKNLTQCRKWYGQRLNELEAWFRGPGKDLPIAKQFWNILANGKADPTAPPTPYVLRAVYELLQAQNTRLREDMDELRETLLIDSTTRHCPDDAACRDAEVRRLQAENARLTEERDTAQANYQFMVNRAADEKLDGYRELGARAAHAENTVDRLRARLDCEDAAGLRHCRYDAPCLTCARRTLASLTAERDAAVERADGAGANAEALRASYYEIEKLAWDRGRAYEQLEAEVATLKKDAQKTSNELARQFYGYADDAGKYSMAGQAYIRCADIVLERSAEGEQS